MVTMSNFTDLAITAIKEKIDIIFAGSNAFRAIKIQSVKEVFTELKY